MKLETLTEPSGKRIADDLWTLVNIPSPTRREREAAFAFAEMLRGAGAEVELDDTLPDSPSVIGRLKGTRKPVPGVDMPHKTLQLAGHIDHIDVAHPDPVRDEEIISGRGTADMKGGLAGILEIVRVLNSGGCDFSGELLITAYGLHEAPLGDAGGLLNLINRGILGDAAIIFESEKDDVSVICGKGQSIWDLTVRQTGKSCHELKRNPEADCLLGTALNLAHALRDKNRQMAQVKHNYPLLGPESVFIGQLHYGDFYNRVPEECRLQGTWRWHPDHCFDDAEKALHRLVVMSDCPENVSIEENWTFVGESFEVDPQEPIVQAYKNAFCRRYGRELPDGGTSGVADTSRLVPTGKVPTIQISFDGKTAHADYEFVRLSRLEEKCRLALSTVLHYLQADG